MPASRKCQYFLGLIPPSPIAEEIALLKEYFRDHYHSRAALNSPPHITLHMPFEWREDRESELVASISTFASRQSAFPLQLRDFGCFEPRVIFINVLPEPALDGMQSSLHRYCKTQLDLYNALYQDRPFHPHLTLAFRDLKKSAFRTAWEEFKNRNFEAVFAVNAICLLKHNGRQWNLNNELAFATSFS